MTTDLFTQVRDHISAAPETGCDLGKAILPLIAEGLVHPETGESLSREQLQAVIRSLEEDAIAHQHYGWLLMRLAHQQEEDAIKHFQIILESLYEHVENVVYAEDSDEEWLSLDRDRTLDIFPQFLLTA